MTAIPVLMNHVAHSIEERLAQTESIATVCRFVLMLSLWLFSSTPIAIFADFVGIIPATTVTLNCFIWPALIFWADVVQQAGSDLGFAVRVGRAAQQKPVRFLLDAVITLIALIAMVLEIMQDAFMDVSPGSTVDTTCM